MVTGDAEPAKTDWEGVYSEEKRVAPTMNSWMEDGGPGKEARDCLESQRETRS